MTEPALNTVSSAPRWMRLALVGSLALNLAVAGLVGGAFLAHRGDHPEGRDGPDISIGALPHVLGREDRQALREGLRAHRDERRTAAINDLKALSAALRTDPFDPGAVQAVFDRQVTRLSEGLREGQQIMAGRFAAMPRSERVAIADRLDALASNPRKMRMERGRTD